MEEKIIHVGEALSDAEIAEEIPAEMLDELTNGKGEDE